MATYLDLTASQRGRADPVQHALAQVVATPSSLTPGMRGQLVWRLLVDLSQQVWDEPTTLAAVSALKALARTPEACQELATEQGLHLLVDKGGLLASHSPASKLQPSSLEALRCLCNVLLLDEPSRELCSSLPGVLRGAVGLLSGATTPAAQFLAGRMLFLFTIKGGQVVRSLVEEHGISEVLAETLGNAVQTMQRMDSGDPGERAAALSEQLKFLFNIAVFYPRLVELDGNPGVVSPVPSSSASPFSSPTLDAGAESTGMFRKTSSNIKDFFSGRSKTGTRSRTPSPNLPSPLPGGGQRSVLQGRGFDRIAAHLIALAVGWPTLPSEHLPAPPLSQALHALAEFAMSASWLSSPETVFPLRGTLPNTGTSDSEATMASPLAPLPARLLHLLDRATAQYCPKDVDPSTWPPNMVSDVDASLASLLLLMRKIVVGDATGSVQRSFKARLLADDIDRSQHLEQRDDLTGCLIRLMGSVYLPNTKVGASELVFALCGQEATVLSRTIGWGNAAGFLMANNLADGPPAPQPADFDVSIDPVTGTFWDQSEAAGPEMSEEEKDREAERMFVLFERLAKTGVVHIQNPMQQAQSEGRLEEIGEMEAEQVQRERQEEREALDDLMRYKQRKAKLNGSLPEEKD